jgi:hypothetical protein
LNRQTRGLQTYDLHRRQIMTLITAATPSVASNPSLIVLGAGNCLDLDLRELVDRFHSVCLLDLDRTALEFGVEAQFSATESDWATRRSSIQLVAPLDIAAPLASLQQDHFAPGTDLTELIEQLSDCLPILPVEPADVVASTCLLSQIIGALLHLATDQHPQFLSLLQSLRRGHLRRMLQLIKPGGCGLFVSDLVSSETTPALQNCTDPELPGLLAQCLNSGNFFSGLNPGVVLQDFRNCPEIAANVANVQILPPWKWQMGPRTYAVYAIHFRRR